MEIKKRYNSSEIIKMPYEHLYIYYLDGVVNEQEERFLGKHFIGNWLEDDYSFLFFSAPSKGIIKELLAIRSDLILIDDYRFTYEEWQGSEIKPLRIENFLITPPWEKVEPENGIMKINLDPGVVFGSGLHPTTRDCLRAINYLMEKNTIRKVLDLGTGTGILAISVALLGADEIMAIDLNPLSIKTAVNNVRLNGLEETIKVLRGKAEDFIKKNADLVIANIHYDVINFLLENEHFSEKKYYLFSGLLRTQAKDVRDLIKSNHLTIVREWDHEMTWYTLLTRKV